MALSAQDYMNLLQFSIDINSRFNDFENAVLSFLSNHFNLHISTYAIFDRDSNGEAYISKSLSKYFNEYELNLYNTTAFKTDPMYINRTLLRASNASRYVYTMETLGNVIPSRSMYEQQLARHSIQYQAVIDNHTVSNMPVHVISIFKTVEQGPFTGHELELFDSLGKVFNETMVLYTEYMHNKRCLLACSQYLDSVNIGVACLDQQQHLLVNNQQFLSCGMLIFGQHSAEEIVNCFFRQSADECRTLPLNSVYHRTVGNYTVSLQKKLFTVLADQEIITYLTIRENKAENEQAPAQSKLSLFLGYDLTEREAETALLIIQGKNNQQIADSLYISTSTVKTHIHKIFQKMNVGSRKELLKKMQPP
jgi:DNA-binding CsgD family transcriptional regulator